LIRRDVEGDKLVIKAFVLLVIVVEVGIQLEMVKGV
jgi:hypothetical protein